MKKFRRKRKSISSLYFIIILLLVLGLLSVGYSQFSTDLYIIGNISVSTGKTTIIDQQFTGDSDSTLQKDGDTYYFTGSSTSVNNYINFNSELWRIVAIDSTGIKIQKVESIGSMVWDETTTSSDNDNSISANAETVAEWSTCTLNTYLNTTYYQSISDTYKSYIVTNPVWNVGTSTDGLTVPTKVEYQGTDSDPHPIGLITVQELNDAGGTSGWLTKEKNYHWTITTKSNGTVYRFSGTNILNSSANKSAEVEPVLYLKEDISLTGTGTSSDPYEIKT